MYNVIVSYDPLIPLIGGNYDYWRKRHVDGETELRPMISSLWIANQLAETETCGRHKTAVQKPYSCAAQISECDLKNRF